MLQGLDFSGVGYCDLAVASEDSGAKFVVASGAVLPLVNVAGRHGIQHISVGIRDRGVAPALRHLDLAATSVCAGGNHRDHRRPSSASSTPS